MSVDVGRGKNARGIPWAQGASGPTAPASTKTSTPLCAPSMDCICLRCGPTATDCGDPRRIIKPLPNLYRATDPNMRYATLSQLPRVPKSNCELTNLSCFLRSSRRARLFFWPPSSSISNLSVVGGSTMSDKQPWKEISDGSACFSKHAAYLCAVWYTQLASASRFRNRRGEERLRSDRFQ